MAKAIQSLILLIFSSQVMAFNGEQRLSKKNVIAIFKSDNQTLLLNDDDGNLFNYNGDELSKITFENDVINPTKFLISNQNLKIYAIGGSVFQLSNNGQKTEILSLAPEEKILSVSSDNDDFYIATDIALYIINNKSNSNQKQFEGNIDKVQKVICGSEKCYISLKNLVITPGNQNYVTAEMSSNIIDLDLTSEQDPLVLTSSDLFILKDGKTKQLVPATGALPDGIQSIKNSKRWLYLIRAQSVYVFDWVNSEVKKLGDFSGQLSCTEIDDWSNLWLASTQGIWSFGAAENHTGPFFSGIKITNSKNEELKLPSFSFTNENNLVNVIPIYSYLPNHERIITEWKTENGNWTPFKNDFILSTDQLKNGKNKITLRAKASNSEYTMPYSFELNNSSNKDKIPSYVYLIFSILGGLLLVGFLSLVNIKSKQNEASLQIKQLKAQNELLQSKQQIDQLKMNPHFIFNALTSINGLIAGGNIKEGRKAISLFAKFLRQFLNQSQEESISIEDELELLNNYVNIELLCRNNSFDFEIQQPSGELLDAKIPNMIIQPFIENSIIHAFGNLDRRGKITLSIHESKGYLIAKISDNGVGLGQPKKQNNNHKSVAIDLVRKRLSQRDKNSRSAYVEYLDNNPGTSVNVYLKKITRA